MNKLALFLTAVLAAGFVTIKTAAPPPGPLVPSSNHRKVQERLIAYRCFKPALEDALDALAKGRISLEAACARVADASRGFAPGYLHSLTRAEAGATELERVARNLLGHLKCSEEVNPRLAPRLRALEAELNELVRKRTGVH